MTPSSVAARRVAARVLRTGALALAVACATGVAVAQTRPAGAVTAAPFLSIGITAGGDRIATYDVSGGFGGFDRRTIRGGGIVDLRAGADWVLGGPWGLQTSIGWHSDSVDASNGDAEFRRFPLEVLGTYRLPGTQARVLGGLRFPLSSKFSESGAAGNTRLNLDSSAGLVVGAEWLWTQVGLRVSASLGERYRPSGGGASVSGDHVGVWGTYYFR
jgi:hypothetical protein